MGYGRRGRVWARASLVNLAATIAPNLAVEAGKRPARSARAGRSAVRLWLVGPSSFPAGFSESRTTGDMSAMRSSG